MMEENILLAMDYIEGAARIVERNTVEPDRLELTCALGCLERVMELLAWCRNGADDCSTMTDSVG